jgi:hypothetical protein
VGIGAPRGRPVHRNDPETQAGQAAVWDWEGPACGDDHGGEPGRPAGTAAAVILAIVSAVAVGALLAGQRPRHPVGWLLIGVGLGLAMNLLVESYVKYGLLVRPGSLPAARYLVGFSVLSFTLVWLSCAGFVLLLTPTGSLPSPRWRWWARVAVAGLLVAVVAGAVQPDPLEPQYHGNPLAVPAL